MKNMLKCSSLIRVAIIMIVMVFMASQVTDTYAKKKNKNRSNDDYSSDDSSDDNNTTGGGRGHDVDCCDEIQAKLDQILEDGGGECPDCPDAWSKLLTNDRFELVMSGAGVLDKETCLVWEQSPDTTLRTWFEAQSLCINNNIGGRHGWRPPTIEELASLLDTAALATSSLALPTDHPFSNVQSSVYWSSSTVAHDAATSSWFADFLNGDVDSLPKDGDFYVWCVRGGQGHDAY